MADVDVQVEQEQGQGWRYQVALSRDGQKTEHTVRLAWVDHEHWCGGRVAPSKVVEALMAFLLRHEFEHEIPRSFDAATVRRWFPEVDQELAERL